MTTKLSFNQIDGAVVNVKDYGAVGDGVTDDRTAIFNANAAGDFVLPSGTYLINSDITLSSDWVSTGGILKPASGVTVTLQGNYQAGQYQVFDVSAGGSFTVSEDNSINEIETCHFGGTRNDQTAADANMRAIKAALDTVYIGITTPNGLYKQPTVRLSNGLWYVDDNDSDGVGALIHSYTVFKGYGDSSAILLKDSAKTFNLFVLSDTGGMNSIIIDDMQIAGNRANQTNTQHGIVVTPSAGAVIYSEIGSGMYIKEFNGNGILIEDAGMDNSIVAPRLCRDNTLSNLKITSCDKLKVKGSYRSAKTTYHGIEISSTNVQDIDIDAECSENGGDGINISTTGTESRVKIKSGCTIEANGADGIYAESSPRIKIGACDIKASTENGIYLTSCDDYIIDKPSILVPKQRGIRLNTCNDGCVSAHIVGASDTNNNIYDAVLLESSDRNNLSGIKVVQGATFNTRYAIAIDNAACDNNRIYNNDLEQGATGGILDSGTGTDTTSVNLIR